MANKGFNMISSIIYNMCGQQDTNYNDQVYEKYRHIIRNYLRNFVILSF